MLANATCLCEGLLSVGIPSQILLQRAAQDYPKDSPPPLRFIRSCSSSLAAPTLHKLEAAFKVPVLEVYTLPTVQQNPFGQTCPTGENVFCFAG